MERASKGLIIQKAVFATLGIASGVVVAIFLRAYISSLLVAVCVILGVVSGGCVLIFSPKRVGVAYKCGVLLSGLLAVVVGLALPIYYSGLASRLTSVDAVIEWINSLEMVGIYVLFGLTVLQVVVLPVPSALTVVAGAIVYSPLVSFVVGSIGAIIGAIICFALGRIFGTKVAVWLIGEERTDKYAAVMTSRGKPLFVAMLLFPFFPDDYLCILAGLSKMKFSFFAVVTVLTRPVMIAVYSWLGTDDLLGFDTVGIIMRVLIFAVCVAVVAITYKLSRRDKKSEE